MLNQNRRKHSLRKKNHDWLKLLLLTFVFVFFSGVVYALSPGTVEITGIVHIQQANYCPDIALNPPSTTPIAIICHSH